MATIADDFNRADADGLGTATVGGVSQGWSWTEVAGDIDIVSNEARGGSNGVNHTARAESDLGSADHYAEVDVVAFSDGTGPCVRFSGSVQTCYVAIYDGNVRIFKIQTGSFTQVGATYSSLAAGTYRLSVSGTTLDLLLNGVSQGTRTDSDIASNTRTGIRSAHTNDRLDNFAAGDLGGGGGNRRRRVLMRAA